MSKLFVRKQDKFRSRNLKDLSQKNLIDFIAEIQKSQKFNNHEGMRDNFLNSFCSYSNKLKPEDDIKDPRHWDIGILVTGVDMWVEKNGVRNDDTLGVARTNGMCHHQYSCAVGRSPKLVFS